MDLSDTNPTLLACRHWLGPLARWLLRSGVTWKEFSALSRAVFVRTATDEFGLKGRPTNVSRVALLTGLTRRDVRRQMALEEAAPARAEDRLSQATRVLSAWHQDPAYLDHTGQPRVLDAEGPAPSFSALLTTYAGDIPHGALLKELVSTGSIKKLPNARLQVLKRYYMPRQMDPAAVMRAGSVLADLTATVEFNLSRKPRQAALFEGRAQNRSIDAGAAPAFREFLEHEAQQFLERIDDWLTAHEVPPHQAGARSVRLGAGVYAIHDSESGERP